MSPVVAVTGNKMRPSKLSAKRAGPTMPRDTLCSGQKSHGHDYASYHRNHRSFARWRRFLWARPLVVSLYGREQPAASLRAPLFWVNRTDEGEKFKNGSAFFLDTGDRIFGGRRRLRCGGVLQGHSHELVFNQPASAARMMSQPM
jgi:hypothetical protein